LHGAVVGSFFFHEYRCFFYIFLYFFICKKVINSPTTSGFMPIERVWLDQFEQAGFIDTFRTLNTKKTEVYSWWDMKTRARSRNVGWRIDYFFADKKIQKDIKKAAVLMEKEGSDHCPVQLDILL